MHEIVIVGGGFGGLYAAKRLRRTKARVTLIDRRNFHVFQPLLYQVATGGLSPGNITSALRWVLRRQANTRVWLADVVGFDTRQRRVLLSDGIAPYDTLIVATGVQHHYFGHDDWARHAPGLKTIEDATEMRRRVLLAFEAAEREPDPQTRAEWLTFAIVGAGPTGVELAGAIAELAYDTLKRDFRAIDTTTARIVLVEGADRVLPQYPASLGARCNRSLQRLKVAVRTNTLVTNITERSVTVSSDSQTENIGCRTVLWGAGVSGSPLGVALAQACGADVDKSGRVIVEPDLSVSGHPDVFVIGDLANYSHQTGAPLPGVAPVAMSEGRYVAWLIKKRLAGKSSTKQFHYVNKGQLATIGRAAGVADFGWIRFSGYPAWLLWLFVHLVFLIQFEQRLLVMIQWAWNYFTRHRGTRIISEPKEP